MRPKKRRIRKLPRKDVRWLIADAARNTPLSGALRTGVLVLPESEDFIDGDELVGHLDKPVKCGVRAIE
jgi:hypothetical protein